MMKISAIKNIKPLTDECFDKFRKLIYKETGISMNDSKKILIANRLRRRLIEHHLESYEDYYKFITTSLEGRKEFTNFINAISTNETYFFRGENHFDVLKEIILPELFMKRRQIKIWSAGCSTGEEPYTICIVLLEAMKRYKWNGNISIIATDISTEVLRKAQSGIYYGRTLKFVTEDIINKYFNKVGDEEYEVSNIVKRWVTFKRHNLLKDPPPDRMFDIIFCRNVMIYFDKDTQKMIVDNTFANALTQDGYLFIGHSESLIGKSEKFGYANMMKAPIYRFKNQLRRDIK